MANNEEEEARTITGQGALLGSGGQPELHCSACLHFVRFTTRFSLCAACYIRSVPLCEPSLCSEKKSLSKYMEFILNMSKAIVVHGHKQ